MKNLREFEKDILEIISKYSLKISTGDIVDTLLSLATTIACVKSHQTDELENLENDLMETIARSVHEAKVILRARML